LQGALDLTGGALGKALLTAVSLAGLAVVALVLLITEPSASPAAARLEALAGLEGTRRINTCAPQSSTGHHGIVNT
jgi:hypothetical protein